MLNRANGTTTPDLWSSRPREAVSSVDFDEWLAYVAADRGIGIVPALAAELAAHPGVTYHPIKDAPEVTVSLVTRARDRRPAAAALAEWAAQRSRLPRSAQTQA